MRKTKKIQLTDDPILLVPLHGNVLDKNINGTFGWVIMTPGHKYKLAFNFDEKHFELIGIFKGMIGPIEVDFMSIKPPEPIVYIFDIIDSEGKTEEMKFYRGLFNNRTIFCYPFETEDYKPIVNTPEYLLN